MAFCESCGKPLGDGVAFCPSCGTAVPAHAETAPPTPETAVLAPDARSITPDSAAPGRHRLSRRTLVVGGGVLVVAIVAVTLILSGTFSGKEWMSGFAGTWKMDGKPAVSFSIDTQSKERGVIDFQWLQGERQRPVRAAGSARGAAAG